MMGIYVSSQLSYLKLIVCLCYSFVNFIYRLVRWVQHIIILGQTFLLNCYLYHPYNFQGCRQGFEIYLAILQHFFKVHLQVLQRDCSLAVIYQFINLQPIYLFFVALLNYPCLGFIALLNYLKYYISYYYHYFGYLLNPYLPLEFIMEFAHVGYQALHCLNYFLKQLKIVQMCQQITFSLIYLLILILIQSLLII